MGSRRIDRYAPTVHEFAARTELFHAAVARALGVHNTDLKALRLLGAGSVTAAELSREMVLTAAATTALIDRLENAGYAVRERSRDDRRKIMIRALPEGVREVDEIYSSAQTAMTELLASYDTDQFDAIMDFLEKMAAVLERETGHLRPRPITAPPMTTTSLTPAGVEEEPRRRPTWDPQQRP